MAEPAAKRRVAVLISGRGSNLAALIDASAGGASSQLVLVISDRPDAAGLAHAQAAGIATAVIDGQAYPSRSTFEEALQTALEGAAVELICLAGFMRILSAAFVARWQDRLLNIHPSLLPALRGLDTHERALAAGVRFTGCTVHMVRAAVDHGPIIVQAVVPVRADDDQGSLAARVLAAEHRCYPLALELVASGRAVVRGERVMIDAPGPPADWLMINPPPG